MKDWIDAPWLARIELDHLWRLVFKNQEMLKKYGLLGKKPPKPLEGGTGGAKYWDELLRRDSPSITAKMALGSWQTGYDSYSQHYLKYINPHSSHPQWTVGVKTPLVDSASDLRLTPASGSSLLIDEAGTLSGTADRLVGIQKVYSSAISSSVERMMLVAANCAFADDTKSLYGAEFQADFTGSGHCDGIGLLGSTVLASSASGTIPTGVGVRGYLGVVSGNPSATVTAFSAIQGTLQSFPSNASVGTFSYLHAKDYLSSPSGSITTAIALNLEVPTIATTNYLAKFGGAGNLLCVGTPTFLANAAGIMPLAVKLAASQTADAWQVQNSSGGVLARFNENGFLGIGVDPTHLLEIATETSACNIVAARYGDSAAGQLVLKNARGTIASPSATQSGDALGNIYAFGYKTSAWGYPCLVTFRSKENFSDSAMGAKITFATTPVGSTVTAIKFTMDSTGYFGAGGNFTPDTCFEARETYGTNDANDCYSAGLTLTPTYSAVGTPPIVIARHNYIHLKDVSVGGGQSVTNGCIFRFDANAGTHTAVDSGTTKTSPGTVNAWPKININGTIYYIPAYTSKTS